MNRIREKLTAIGDLIRLKNQYGTLLLLMPALWALVIASSGKPSLRHLIIFTLGAFVMRSAGCVINDIADRDFDKFVERTKTRPLADGRLNIKEATGVFIILVSLALVLVLFLNLITILLSFAAILFAVVYPFVKRVSNFAQVFLGGAFGWGAIMAWTSVHETIAITAIFIFIANILWTTAYDTIYALADIEDDIKIGIKSTAIFFGPRVYDAVWLIYTGMAFMLMLAGVTAKLGSIYYAGVGLSYVFFLTLVKNLKKSPAKNKAFFTFAANVKGGIIVLLAIILDTTRNAHGI